MDTFRVVKQCTACQKEKLLGNFTWKNKTKRILSAWCRACSKIYKDKHYRDNKKYYYDKKKKYIHAYKQKYYRWLFDYFKIHPCIDCGNKNPIVLEFDHVRGNKLASIGKMIGDTTSWKRVLGEIKKCEVRCKNCHTIKTAKQFNWYENYDLVV